MKDINIYINEGLTKKQANIISELIVDMFKGTKLNKDNMKSILYNIKDLDVIKAIEHHISDTDMQNSLPYIKSDDEFLKPNVRDIVIPPLADYFVKFICN